MHNRSRPPLVVARAVVSRDDAAWRAASARLEEARNAKVRLSSLVCRRVDVFADVGVVSIAVVVADVGQGRSVGLVGAGTSSTPTTERVSDDVARTGSVGGRAGDRDAAHQRRPRPGHARHAANLAGTSCVLSLSRFDFDKDLLFFL